jgi:hypothetical protein
MVYEYAATRIRVPLPRLNVYSDTINTSLLRTCKLVREEARMIFDRSRRGITPVLTFEFKKFEDVESAYRSRIFIYVLWKGYFSNSNGQIDLSPLEDIVQADSTIPPANTAKVIADSKLDADLRSLYLTMIRRLLAGEALQVRILLGHDDTPDQVDHKFWVYYTGALSLYHQHHLNIKLVFVTPLGTSAMYRDKLSSPAEWPSGLPSYTWALEEGGAILDVECD